MKDLIWELVIGIMAVIGFVWVLTTCGKVLIEIIDYIINKVSK